MTVKRGRPGMRIRGRCAGCGLLIVGGPMAMDGHVRNRHGRPEPVDDARSAYGDSIRPRRRPTLDDYDRNRE